MRISHRLRAGLIALAALAGAGVSSAAYADSGSIRISVLKGGWFIGASGGSGTLIFHGRAYPLSIGGLSAGLVFGASETYLIGRVSHIFRPSDVAGVYGAVGAGAALGDSNSGMHLLIGVLAALLQREKTGKGQRVYTSMQEAVLNLCRVKLRDQQRLERVGYLEEYPQYPNGKFGDAVPRGGNAGGGGQPGWVLKCKGWETDPNAYIYFTIQDSNWPRTDRRRNMGRRLALQR